MNGSPDEMKTAFTIESRYQILEKIGSGGAGVVYKARDRDTGAILALKVLHAHIANTPELLQSLKSELLLARKITHKNICRVYDLNRLGDASAISMEFIEGESLRGLLKRERTLPVESGLRLIRQVLAGIGEAHAQNVVHRDLKPENILIGADGVVKVMDFGVARSVDPGATHTATLSGTPAYMSPEQAQARASDARTDIYSLGLIMYELFTGRMAFTGDNAVSVALKQINEAPATPRAVAQTIPETVEAIILKCIEKDPQQRFQSARELDAAIGDYLDGNTRLTFQATPSRLAASAKPVGSRTKWISASAAVLLLAGVIALIYRLSSHAPAAQAQLVRVLITDFDNQTGESVFDGTLEPMLGLALEGAPFINVYRQADARNSAAQLRPGATKIDESLGLLVATRDGVNVVISGAISKQQTAYKLSIRVITDPQSGQNVVTRDATAKNKDGILSAVAEIVPPIRAALGDAAPESVQRAAAETFTTSSIEAVHTYIAAQNLQSQGKYDEAIRSYSDALKLDPEFGRAYSGLAITNANLGRYPEAAQYFKEALARIGKMTDREKYRTRGGYFYSTRNYRAAIDEFTNLLKEYPADSVAHTNLAASYFISHDLGRALEEQRRATEIYPSYVLNRNNSALYEMYMGDFRNAVQDAESALKLNPQYVKANIILGVSHLASGNVAQASATFERMKTLSGRLPSLGAIGLAEIALFEGRAKEAAAILEEGIAANVDRNETTDAARKRAMLARIYMSLGEGPKALKLADAATTVKEDGLYVSTARIFVAAGQQERARTLMQDLTSSARSTIKARAYSNVIQSEILTKKRDFTGAVDSLYEAIKLDDVWLAHFDLGLAYLEKGAFTEASSEFEKCLKRQGEATFIYFDEESPTYDLLPPIYYYLGRAQEGLHSSSAADSYRKFLSFQKADENPLTADARDRLARLQ